MRRAELFQRPRLRVVGLVAAAGLALAPAARAEDASQLRDFCAERPGRATPPCIVDQGQVMLEVDAFDVSRERAGGVTTRTIVALSPHVRVGLTDTIEAGVTLEPYTEIRAHGDRVARSTVRGTGDTILNLKISLMNPSGQAPSVAILPFVIAPTAQHGLGVGGFQGGIIVPAALSLPAGFTLGLDPEMDAVRDGRGGVRAAYIVAASVSHPVLSGATLGVEYWSSGSRMPGGWQRQATADVTLAWIPPRQPNLQLDAGVNLGLTRQTPDVQAYVGVSRRF